MDTIKKTWKVQADPEHAGKHPMHDNRFITTSDFDFIGANRDDEKIVCSMRDLLDDQKQVAQLIAAAPDMLDALETWQAFWDEMPQGQLGKIVCNIGLLNDAFLKTSAAFKKVKA